MTAPILGTPTYVDGPAGKGKGMLFPGTAGNAVNLGTFNPSEKTGMLSVSLWAKWNGLSTQWQGLIGKRNSWADGETMWQIEANQTTGALSFSRYNITAGHRPGPEGGRMDPHRRDVRQDDGPVLRQWRPDRLRHVLVRSRREASLQIGCDNAGGGNAFNGALDEVKLYDIVLTPAEILTLAGK